ncbi:MAG: polyribonucleotide nucleotidyltransferase [Endozoicomonadaceae bacterium]|nr:polyribonucleotide nucleotidyltransferase [Endozoicomonadaceae bacterium]
MNCTKKTFTFGNQEVSIETGRIARQATSAVMVKMGQVCVLTTVVADKELKDKDFFPLSVNYQERAYAAGKIPGSFMKREGRPTEKEILTSRVIDRPVRPLFPKGFMNEVQIICTVLSTDKKYDPDIAAMIGTSAALAISGLPFNGPLGAARVGFTEEKGYILNPSYEEIKSSELDMVVAGTKEAILMVESEAKELTEDEMLGAVLFAQQEYQCVINAINELAEEVGKKPWSWHPESGNDSLKERVDAAYGQQVTKAYEITQKTERNTELALLRKDAIETIASDETISAEDVKKAFGNLEKSIVRNNVINGLPRIDGRDTRTVRPLDIEVDVLPGTHGSALFTRGETQALVTATLGAARDAQKIDYLEGDKREPFILHYNFPPFSVGECGRIGSPGRREIGHGRLARRGIQAVLPEEENFPYAIRVVSEITESNGSSSMASVCGASLALMDAGVPLKTPVAGIAMGLVKEGDKFAVLTDILGDEDHLGDMDFKVAGSKEGITALQMDIKIAGITEEIMDQALEQAFEARIHILEQMNKVISKSREELSDNAPMTITMQISPEKIRDVIGKGGVTIRSICDDTGATVDISDSGEVKIYAENKEICKKAEARVLEITAEVKIGEIYEGTVNRILEFGAFVNILPGQDGLVHISQIADQRVNNVNDHVSVGQKVKVVATDVDQRGRIKLSMKPTIIKAAENNAF